MLDTKRVAAIAYFYDPAQNLIIWHIFFIYICRADKSVLASSGFQGDIKALQKNLSAKHLVGAIELLTASALAAR